MAIIARLVPQVISTRNSITLSRLHSVAVTSSVVFFFPTNGTNVSPQPRIWAAFFPILGYRRRSSSYSTSWCRVLPLAAGAGAAAAYHSATKTKQTDKPEERGLLSTIKYGKPCISPRGTILQVVCFAHNTEHASKTMYHTRHSLNVPIMTGGKPNGTFPTVSQP